MGSSPTFKAQPSAAWAVALLMALCALFMVPASAQAPESVFVAQSVRVDITANNAATAQTQGLARAEQLGFERVARRLTLPAERTAIGQPRAEGVALQRMIARVDVDEERRSTTRYIARLTVRTNPENVRAFLRQAGYTVVETRTAPVLVAPVATAGVTAPALQTWREAWEGGGFAGELVPVAVASAALTGAPSWDAAADAARAAAATAAIYARLTIAGSTARAELVEVTAAGRRDRGTVEARIAAGETGLAVALASLAESANAVIQDEWKATLAAGRGQQTRVTVSAIYSNQDEWERVKRGLGAAGATLVSDVSIDALSTGGALVSFSYVGDRAQLATELARQGLALSDGPLGVELRLARR
ncbi:MAG: hypothetical protein ACOYKM_02210 [Caulobacterales bacterium]